MKFDPIEIAVIKELIFDELTGLIPDWKKAYQILNPDCKTENLIDYTSHWKNKARVKKLYNELKDIINNKLENRLNLDSNINSGDIEIDSTNKGLTDYTKRLNIIKFLNSQLNTVSDDKQKLDYIKTLIDLLRLKEDQNKNTNDIQRFYTVITCSNCELYKQKQVELNNNNDSL